MDTNIYLGLVGIVLTSYAIYVAIKYKHNGNAMCDINNTISCTRVLRSPDAYLIGKIFKLQKNHILNVPNTYLGMLYYILVTIYNVYPLALFPQMFREICLLIASSLALLTSFYLGYSLKKSKTVCIVCVFTYAVNFGIFLHAYHANWILINH